MINNENILGFEWDDGNKTKNMQSHGVSIQESEQIFFNTPLILSQDVAHSSQNETRLAALGKTDEGRLLSIFFTIRNNLIRVISARAMSKKEQKVYHEKAQEHS